ncbi:decarboxylating NADP(+)-dependent phosphogluconate dehydrogenase [Dechloromonas denitrificans]|uniref:decarboxylating NADP(+)-dependent phosphogluconate dehydrogenase n=1 Tax=Dechloromonas denitrificans TaxID=281362 RepID=UPI001CFBC820|nr:decarboxylating NADP(+)-dependent phosphogluconate dehydrogenase [Dechloromonas denitrificans]UCV09509.1 decarboxylating NADP(+)-dependent phosphogluconate dehydrogenase [Dechloromonas denitrificans]
MSRADIGVIGLGVMGANLALNLNDKGFRLCVYNRTAAVTSEFVAAHGAGRAIAAADSPQQLVSQLARPRIILLMVTAGRAVEAVIGQLQPLLEAGDIVIDGGNSNYRDSQRRCSELAGKGIHFVGLGVSGGEAGARHGPSLMPGGAVAAWPTIRPMLQAIAATVDGVPCCQWLGDGGAGHYVKMVHNGIEYGDMQLIAEVCHLMQHALGMSHAAMAETFAEWNAGRLESYLIEITSHILRQRDSDGSPLVDHILDRAGQKGTGVWTAQDALDRAVPLTLIGEAVQARMLSARKAERVAAAALLGSPPARLPETVRTASLAALHDALYAAKLVSYTQGFMLLQAAAEAEGWVLPYGDIAQLWRAGCIIRSRFLADIKTSFSRQPVPPSLLQDPFFVAEIKAVEAGWRQAVMLAVGSGVAAPALASALAFYDGYRCANGSANILQAQRDFFGAHAYQRTDRDGSENFHTRWQGDGGEETLP